jgi:hypothetical protein
MDFNAIIKRVTAILTKPKEEWDVIKNETMSVADMYTKYAIIVAAIPALAGFIGFALIGISTPFGSIRMPIGSALLWAILQYAFTLGAPYLLAIILDALAPNFGAQKDMNLALKIAIFSATAAWVSGVLLIIPTLGVIALIAGGIYSMFLLYMGIQKLKEVPQDKLMGFVIILLVVNAVILFLIDFLVKRITFGAGAAFIF